MISRETYSHQGPQVVVGVLTNSSTSSSTCHLLDQELFVDQRLLAQIILPPFVTEEPNDPHDQICNAARKGSVVQPHVNASKDQYLHHKKRKLVAVEEHVRKGCMPVFPLVKTYKGFRGSVVAVLFV
jgi:hypothetical protein